MSDKKEAARYTKKFWSVTKKNTQCVADPKRKQKLNNIK